MIGWLNGGSLVLGLIAWILPLLGLIRYTNHAHHNWAVLSIMSMSACTISLFFQILTSYHRVTVEDWSALMDIMGAKVLVAAVLLIVTIILNVLTLLVYRTRTVK